MNTAQILENLKIIVKPYIKDEEAFEKLTVETDFLTDLKINSANLVDIILDIEEKFNIEINNQEMENMLKVKNALDIVETKLNQQ